MVQVLKEQKENNLENKMKITKKTKFSKILESNEDAAEILLKAGLHCVGCPMTSQESLEDGCLSHGMSGKEIDKLVTKLNKK